MRNTKVNRILKIIFIVVFVITILFMLFAIVSISLTDNKRAVPIFGYGFYSVMSGSMEPEIYAYDIIMIKVNKAGEEPPLYNIGDIVVYESFSSENLGESITHRIIGIEEDGRYILKGDSNSGEDLVPVYPSQILGKYVTRFPGANKLISFLRSTLGFILLIVVPAMFLIIIESFNFIKLFRKLKIEQQKEIVKEKEQLDTLKLEVEEEKLRVIKEKEETLILLEEIKALKEQLNIDKVETKDTKKGKDK